MDRLKRVYNVALNVVTLVASVAILVTISSQLYARYHRGPRFLPPELKAGAKAPVLPGVDYSSSDRTLVLFLSTFCIHCEEATPFYRKLAEKADGNRRMLGVFAEDPQLVTQFKSRFGLTIDTIAAVPSLRFGIRGTPTLVLVSRSGQVVQTWVGSPPAEENAIANAFLADALPAVVQSN